MTSTQTPFPAPLPERAIFDLSGRTRLLFSGADRLRYLNGQLTQDLKKLQPGRALPACVTSAKGKLQADVWVAFAADAQGPISVDAAPELREALAARLERYIVADDVTLADASDAGALLHCVGFAGQTPDSPADPGTQTRAEGLPEMLAGFPRTASTRLGEEGWDIWVPTEQLGFLKPTLGGHLASPADWELRRILRRIPAWGAELDENTLPPEAGLERTHIDYHKGCYIGQEVISRLKSVGHVNRTLHLLKGAGGEAPPVGSPLRTETGEEAGSITSVAPLDGGAFLALAYVKRAHLGARLLSASGTPLEMLGV